MVLQELEGFTFATALDLNMGYYTIRLDPDASKICTIIFLLQMPKMPTTWPISTRVLIGRVVGICSNFLGETIPTSIYQWALQVL
jgi:hypothetical protein